MYQEIQPQIQYKFKKLLRKKNKLKANPEKIEKIDTGFNVI